MDAYNKQIALRVDDTGEYFDARGKINTSNHFVAVTEVCRTLSVRAWKRGSPCRCRTEVEC